MGAVVPWRELELGGAAAVANWGALRAWRLGAVGRGLASTAAARRIQAATPGTRDLARIEPAAGAN
jgi:hypothetical protein